MNFSIQSAKTIDEAVEKALKELKASRDEVDVEIVEEPSGGFLGLIGGKDAIVKVKKKFDNKDIIDSILQDEEIKKLKLQKLMKYHKVWKNPKMLLKRLPTMNWKCSFVNLSIVSWNH